MALILIRGGGDLASGVALRLHRAGLRIVITELPQPLAVRRTVSFSEAVYEGQISIEGVAGRLVQPAQIHTILEKGEVPVLIDPEANILTSDVEGWTTVVDARMLKQPPSPLPTQPPLHIGLGPGFQAGENCHAVIETRRSHTLGRVYWTGSVQPDSSRPEGDPRRVLRAPVEGVVLGRAEIGSHVKRGQVIAEIQETGFRIHQSSTEKRRLQIVNRKSLITSPFKGVLRGLIRSGLPVTQGMKIGDVDVRDDPRLCYLVSDKALAVGGAVLEAILTKPEIRAKLKMQ